jgi:hypothetical protein
MDLQICFVYLRQIYLLLDSPTAGYAFWTTERTSVMFIIE